MRFCFDEEKTTQAAAYLLGKFLGRHNAMALMKLLYLADRRALIERGLPITGDHMVSMPHGPVLSQTLDLINCGRPPGVTSAWVAAIGPREGHDVELISDPGVDALSEYEIAILEQVHSQYGHLNQWQLRDFTHSLPEWRDPQGSSVPIDPIAILEEAGLGKDEIQLIVRECEQRYALQQPILGTGDDSGESRCA